VNRSGKVFSIVPYDTRIALDFGQAIGKARKATAKDIFLSTKSKFLFTDLSDTSHLSIPLP